LIKNLIFFGVSASLVDVEQGTPTCPFARERAKSSIATKTLRTLFRFFDKTKAED
jgi:hypothetical protein